MEALGVGPGKEVLVPGLTWRACATSVSAIGAKPVFVDIDQESLCMSLIEARKAISVNTAAIMLVHMYCRIADLDGFLTLSKETGIPIIEDCSHVHGAVWKGQRVGTFGHIGVFSMQQTKVLTCGEGGAAITKDQLLYEKMQQHRADGRLYQRMPAPAGKMDLVETGNWVPGSNYCMSEFHAAILLDRIQHLDNENNTRMKNAAYLDERLLETGYLHPLSPSSETDNATYYHYCVRVDLQFYGGKPIDFIAKALSAELGILITPVYASLSKSLPQSKGTAEKCLVIPHEVLLADNGDIKDIVDAFIKIQRFFASNEKYLEKWGK